MPGFQVAPLTELPASRDAAAVSALWSLAHPLGPCAGDPSPAAEDAWGVEHEGRLIALGAVRTWGRVGLVHGLAVAEPARQRGIGAALLDELVRELERRDAAVIGMEVDASGAGALTTMARSGFKPMQLSFILEAPVPEAAADEVSGDDAPAADAPGDEDRILLQGSAGAEQADLARMVAASVDAELDPSAWLAARLARDEAEALVLGSPGAPSALAVLPRIPSPDALAVSQLLCAEGPPRHVLPPMIAALARLARARSLPRLQVAAPSRYWEATRALLDMGFRPRASFLRLTRQGHPERADLGRTCLMTWR